uniref:Uncharacterized protein n=1 Tax=Meloidogyne javanica TaxID=6303 RepID=A0A915MN54_MELJA
MNNIKEEMAKNKELQENKKQLEERLKKLADTSVKEKYMKIQKESNASTELIKHQLNEFSDYVNKLAVSIKDSQLGQDAFKQLKAAAEVAEQVAKQVGDTQVYRQVANTANEIDKLADVRMYSKPGFLFNSI